MRSNPSSLWVAGIQIPVIYFLNFRHSEMSLLVAGPLVSRRRVCQIKAQLANRTGAQPLVA